MILIVWATVENPRGSVEKLSPQKSPSGAYTVLRGSVSTLDILLRGQFFHTALGFSTVAFRVWCRFCLWCQLGVPLLLVMSVLSVMSLSNVCDVSIVIEWCRWCQGALSGMSAMLGMSVISGSGVGSYIGQRSVPLSHVCHGVMASLIQGILTRSTNKA